MKYKICVTNNIEFIEKLIVMENGTISGIGTHKELLQNNSLYKKFVDQQTKREL